jgi:hypothetical protein
MHIYTQDGVIQDPLDISSWHQLGIFYRNQDMTWDCVRAMRSLLRIQVCIYVCMCVCIYVCINIYVHDQKVWTYMCMCVCVCAYKYEIRTGHGTVCVL